MTDQKFIRRKDAADYLKQKYGFGSKGTLAKLATVGGGPVFSYAGARLPLYTIDALDAWANAKIGRPQKSTSDNDEEA